MMKFDPNAKSFPKRHELPTIPGAPEGAAWFWGPEDEVINGIPLKRTNHWLTWPISAWAS